MSETPEEKAKREAREARERAYAAAEAEWLREAAARVRAVADRQQYLCADDVWNYGLRSAPRKTDPRALGGVFTREADAGTIEVVTGVTVKSNRRHRTPMQLWKSQTYDGPDQMMPDGVKVKRCPHCDGIL